LFVIIFHRGIIAILFSREISKASGIPERTIFYLILILCSTIISINLYSVGGLLIYGLIIIPASCAYQFTYKISSMYLLSSLIAVIACILGLFISAILSVPVGATIILVLSLFFVISVILSRKNGYE
jgi:manganese/iron transport system permease protein